MGEDEACGWWNQIVVGEDGLNGGEDEACGWGNQILVGEDGLNGRG